MIWMTGRSRPENSGKAERQGTVLTADGTPFPRSSRVMRSLKHIQLSWSQPLEKPLGWRHRFLCAFLGAALWMSGRVVTSATSIAALDALVPGGFLSLIAGVLVASLWFAYLVSYQERKCSPSRLFIEGLLFPAFTGALLTAESPINVALENLENLR